MRGEELLVNKLSSFYQKFKTVMEGLLNLINDINRNVMIKLKATYTNDARIQLEAVSLPSIEEIYKDSAQKIEDYIVTLKSMKKELATIYQLAKNNHVSCPRCDGEGIKYRIMYFREDGIVTPYMKGEKCGLCGGNGYLAINKDFAYSMSLYLELLLNILGSFSIFNENEYE